VKWPRGFDLSPSRGCLHSCTAEVGCIDAVAVVLQDFAIQRPYIATALRPEHVHDAR